MFFSASKETTAVTTIGLEMEPSRNAEQLLGSELEGIAGVVQGASASPKCLTPFQLLDWTQIEAARSILSATADWRMLQAWEKCRSMEGILS